VVSKFKERLAVNKQKLHKLDIEGFSLKKLKEVERKENYLIEVTNGFAALADLDNEVEINCA
jgi:hypothetical protein